LQCVAVCCSVLQCVAVFWQCGRQQHGGYCPKVLWPCLPTVYGTVSAVCCSVLQCILVFLQCVAVCCSVLSAEAGGIMPEGTVPLLPDGLCCMCCMCCSALQCVAGGSMPLPRLSVLQRVALCCKHRPKTKQKNHLFSTRQGVWLHHRVGDIQNKFVMSRWFVEFVTFRWLIEFVNLTWLVDLVSSSLCADVVLRCLVGFVICVWSSDISMSSWHVDDSLTWDVSLDSWYVCDLQISRWVRDTWMTHWLGEIEVYDWVLDVYRRWLIEFVTFRELTEFVRFIWHIEWVIF